MGSGHRSGRPEGRTAPPPPPHEAPGNRHGGGQDRRAQQQRAEPTGRAAEEAFHHPANEPARDEKQTQPDPHQWIHQLQRGRGVSKAVEREEGLQGHHAHPASHRPPPGAPRHQGITGETRVRNRRDRHTRVGGIWFLDGAGCCTTCEPPASTLQVLRRHAGMFRRESPWARPS